MAQRNFPQQLLTLDHVSPATRLLEKRRQRFEVQEARDAQKEDFERREHAFQQREEALRKKDLALQEVRGKEISCFWIDFQGCVAHVESSRILIAT